MARILVIDDEEMIRVMLKRILETQGYETIDASNGTAGLELLREKSADLVITDILMPEGDGTLTIRQIVRDFPGVKVIAISGGGAIADSELCLGLAKRFGAHRAFMKPVSKNDLLAAIRELLVQP